MISAWLVQEVQALGLLFPRVRPVLTFPGAARLSSTKKTGYGPQSVPSSLEDGRTGRLGTLGRIKSLSEEFYQFGCENLGQVVELANAVSFSSFTLLGLWGGLTLRNSGRA